MAYVGVLLFPALAEDLGICLQSLDDVSFSSIVVPACTQGPLSKQVRSDRSFGLRKCTAFKVTWLIRSRIWRLSQWKRAQNGTLHETHLTTASLPLQSAERRIYESLSLPVPRVWGVCISAPPNLGILGIWILHGVAF